MPQNNVTEQITQLLGVEFPPPLDPPEIKSLQKALFFSLDRDNAPE